METKRVNRFLVTHGPVGVPFMALIITGGMIFFSSFWNISLESYALVRKIHLIAAVIWMLILIAMTFVLGLKFHKSTIKLLFRWGKADLDWLRLSFFSLFHPNVQVNDPRVYDVRLKMNFLLVLFSCLAYIITGFQMWF